MSNISETSLDLCGKAKCCPPETNTVNHYTQHVSISDKRRKRTTVARNVVARWRTSLNVTERKTSPIDCAGAYHLSRGNPRLNAPGLVGSLTPERCGSRPLEHVGHLTASHGVWRKGGAGRDVVCPPHTALRPTGLSRGSGPGRGASRPRDTELRSA